MLGLHSAFPIPLKLSDQEHGNDSVSDDNNNSKTPGRLIPASPKDCDNFLLININKNTNNAADRKVCVS